MRILYCNGIIIERFETVLKKPLRRKISISYKGLLVIHHLTEQFLLPNQSVRMNSDPTKFRAIVGTQFIVSAKPFSTPFEIMRIL